MYIYIYTLLSLHHLSLSLSLYTHIIYYKYITPITCLKLVVLRTLHSHSWTFPGSPDPNGSEDLAWPCRSPRPAARPRPPPPHSDRAPGVRRGPCEGGLGRSVIIKEKKHRVMMMGMVVMMSNDYDS